MPHLRQALIVGRYFSHIPNQRKVKYLLLFVCILDIGCNSIPNKIEDNSEKLSLVIIPEYKDRFQLKIDDSLNFNNIQIDKEKHGPQELITKLSKSGDSIKINLHISNRDTIFVKSKKGIDSLIFGLDLQRHFFMQNQDEYIWYYD